MRKLIVICILLWSSQALAIPSGQAKTIIRYNGSSSMLKGVIYDISKVFLKQENIGMIVRGMNTEYGIKKLLAGECDISGGGRSLKTEEKRLELVETRIFMDAYAFIVHRNNPIRSIRNDPSAQCMKGEIPTWDEIGGCSGNMIIISPPKNSMHYRFGRQYLGFSELPRYTFTVEMTPMVFDKVIIYPLSLGWMT